MKKPKLKSYPTYNKINKCNKDVVEVSQDELNNLPESEKKEYKYFMTRDKQKVITPPGPTDHKLLLLILDKVTNLENRVSRLENEVVDIKNRVIKLERIVKINNLKE